MYETILFIHSWLRWIVLILGVVLIIQGFAGMSGNTLFKKSHNGMSAGFVGLFHLQIVLGLILYFFLSPITKAAFQDFGAAMKDPNLRFWAVEHISVMILGAVFAQIGRIKIRKSSQDKAKFKAMAIWFLIAMILVASRIPWSGNLFRGF